MKGNGDVLISSAPIGEKTAKKNKLDFVSSFQGVALCSIYVLFYPLQAYQTFWHNIMINVTELAVVPWRINLDVDSVND